jgi:hypothetical protein
MREREGDSGATLELVDPASFPVTPVSPKVPVVTGRLVAGLIFGVVFGQRKGEQTLHRPDIEYSILKYRSGDTFGMVPGTCGPLVRLRWAIRLVLRWAGL